MIVAREPASGKSLDLTDQLERIVIVYRVIVALDASDLWWASRLDVIQRDMPLGRALLQRLVMYSGPFSQRIAWGCHSAKCSWARIIRLADSKKSNSILGLSQLYPLITLGRR